MIVRVDIDGFGEVFDGLLIAFSFEGLVSFIFELEGLLVAH